MKKFIPEQEILSADKSRGFASFFSRNPITVLSFAPKFALKNLPFQLKKLYPYLFGRAAVSQATQMIIF